LKNAAHVCNCSANVTGSAAAVRSEKLQMLEQKLYKAQEELMEFHRKKGEVSFSRIDVNLCLVEYVACTRTNSAVSLDIYVMFLVKL